MFREIRGVRAHRHWFQSPYFDLFLDEDRAGDPQWFQLCYARDTRRERVLEWRRGRGFQHLKVQQGYDPTRKDSGALLPDGLLPYRELMAQFEASAQGLPPEIARFVADKVRDYARPARRFRRRGARTPRWLERLRESQRTA